MEKRRLVAKKLLSDHRIPAITREVLPHILTQEIKKLVAEQVIVVHQELLPEDLEIKGVEKQELTPEDVRAGARAIELGS